MGARQRPFERFVRRVRRRFVVVRALEATGLGVLVGVAAALPLVTVLLWRDEPAVQVAAAAVAIGVVVGFIAGIGRRPTILDAAMEADRQLRLADLLSSAWAIRDRGDDPWSAAVLSVADARAAGLTPASVMLNRLGARAWGGIGLAAALLFVLAVAPWFTSQSLADEGRGGTSLTSSELAGRQPEPSQADGQQRRLGHRQADPEDPSSDRSAGEEPVAGDTTDGRNADTADRGSASASDPNGRGSGAGQSRPPPSHDQPAAASATPAQGRQGTGGNPSGGAGPSRPGLEGTDATAGASVGATDATASTPPWQTDHWPQDIQSARQSVDSGHIPDTYRDVIRGYFEPQNRDAGRNER